VISPSWEDGKKRSKWRNSRGSIQIKNKIWKIHIISLVANGRIIYIAFIHLEVKINFVIIISKKEMFLKAKENQEDFLALPIRIRLIPKGKPSLMIVDKSTSSINAASVNSFSQKLHKLYLLEATLKRQ